MDEDFIITISDIRKTGHCVSGIRRWFELNDLDFRGFIDNGISAAMLLATEDSMAVEVVEKIKGRKSNG